MSDPSHDPSIENEPHMRRRRFPLDPSEVEAMHTLDREAARRNIEEEDAKNSVWDEPGLSPELSGPPPAGAPTYARWLQHKQAQTTWAFSWFVTLLAALAAGPWAILTALLAGGQHSAMFILNLTVLGPLLEELCKIGVALAVIETKPYLFRSRLQIALCALAGGLVFAAIENVLYLYVPGANPSPSLVRWRWTVCVALHTGCAFLAGVGLMRIWTKVMREHSPTNVALAMPFIIAAVIVHGLYNGTVLILELTWLRF